MAISIVSQKIPNSFHSSANPITLTVNSTNSGKCNFRYINEIYIDGIKVFTAKLFPDPQTGYGFFQIDRVCNDWLEALLPKTWQGNAWNIAGNSAVGAPTSVIQVQCKFGEEYDNSAGCDGTTLQYVNLALSNNFYVFHGAVPYEDWPTFQANDYRIVFASQSSSTAKFLTNAPRDLNIGYNEPYYLDVMGTASPPAYNVNGYVAVRYRIYYKDGSSVIKYYQAPALANTKRWRIHAGSYDINRLYLQSLISDATTYYLVDIVWVGYSAFTDPNFTVYHKLSETFTFRPKEPSPFKTRIGFLGALGSIEQYTFYHRNLKSYDIERRIYNKGLLKNYSNQWTYQVGDRGQSVAWSRVGERHKVQTFATKEESQWINEIYYSPEVFIFDLEPMYRFHTTPRAGNQLDIWIDGEHDIVAGDMIAVFPEYRADTEYIRPNFITVAAASERKLTVTWPYTTVTDYKGCLQKRVSWQCLPVVVQDTSVEVKQKTGRPIQYEINYITSYPKITIK